jgi:hypothetical protein
MNLPSVILLEKLGFQKKAENPAGYLIYELTSKTNF